MFLPGTHIPIHAPERLAETRPDYIVILPWNLREEIVRAARVRPGVGREVRRPHPATRSDLKRAGGKGSQMKVVIFCGGLGLRMRSEMDSAPKPMMTIGDRPVLWHVMRYYAHFGHTEFILCLGYGAAAVKEYFLRYEETMSNDFVMTQGRPAHRAARAPTSASGGSPSSTPASTPHR